MTRAASLATRTDGEFTELSIGLLRRLVRADFETGKLYWLPRWPTLFCEGKVGKEACCRAWNDRYVGKEALTKLSHGYPTGRIFEFGLRAHRVIWALAYGEWADTIDHINNNRADNRLCNLRNVTIAENNRNRTIAEAGIKGDIGLVYNRQPDNWSAFIVLEARYIHLGTFATKVEAAAARNGAARCLTEIRRGRILASRDGLSALVVPFIHPNPTSPAKEA